MNSADGTPDTLARPAKSSRDRLPPKVLGCKVGPAEDVTAQFRETFTNVVKSPESVSLLESAQCELILQRMFFDVCKVTYQLRCNGERVSEDALHQFDAALRGGTDDAIHGRLCDESWIQATVGADASGLGMNESSVVALPAFIASRVASRPLVPTGVHQ
jgi:hypothetical protein